MVSVGVVGAAGYVGRLLCSRLIEGGMAVTGVIRPSSGFLLDRMNVEWVSIEDATGRAPFDVVVNLAYPTSGSVYDYPAQNRTLLDLIGQLSAEGGRVIQVSTQAVFGMALEHPQAAAPLAMRRDFLYVETKLELERLLADSLQDRRLEVLRLGNVWGPGSAAWTGTLAQRLLFGEPVAVRGRDGFSNVTDVGNLVDYIAFLAGRESIERGITFYHLAELGDVPWSEWIRRMSGHLSVVPVCSQAPAYSVGAKDEIRSALTTHPRAIVRDLKDSRFTGSMLRSLVGGLPSKAGRVLRGRWAAGKAWDSATAGEDLFLTVLGCDTRFQPVLDPAWRPPLDADASWRAVASWLDEVGYT